MNIYVVPAWYPENENDVNASFFREQSKALAARGHRITVIVIKTLSYKYLLSKKKVMHREWDDDGVRTVYIDAVIPIPGKFVRQHDSYIDKLHLREIKRLYDEDVAKGVAPEIIHAHVSLDSGYHCVYAAKALNLPLVVTEHYSGLLLGGVDADGWNKVRYTIENADRFIFVGSRFKNTVCQRLGITKKTLFIPNMIKTENYYVSVDKSEKPTFTVLCAGHLTVRKSFDLAVRAFHKAFAGGDNAQLVIAGDGPDRERIESVIKECSENKRVIMYGRYSREESAKMFSDADLFVLTSKEEPFGIVYIEAAASGIPIIATAGQGGEDIVTEENGLLVPYGDIDALADAMRKIYDNHERYDAAAIRGDIEKRFSEDSICAQIEAVYRETVTVSEDGAS